MSRDGTAPVNRCFPAKRLKCNRGNPCDQCIKRNIGAKCTYVPYVHCRDPTRAALPRSGRFGIGALGGELPPQERLRFLEGMVIKLKRELAAQRGSGQPAGDTASTADLRSEVGGDATPTPTGPLLGARYVDKNNWEGIIDDVNTHQIFLFTGGMLGCALT
jgi:hypothetical protein